MALHCAKEIFRSMKTATILAIMLCATATAYADFSYTVAQKTQGSPAAAGPSSTRVLYKGQKMMMDRGAEATVVDFDAQTITTLNKTQKTWSVRKFSELGQGLKQVDTDAKIIDAKMDVKETGQTKMINGFNASEMVMTMEADSPQMSQAGMKMQMEIDIWRSLDVPGAQEMKAFYRRNGPNFPWAAMGSSGAQGMQKAMADMQRKMADAGGVTLLQTIRTKSAGPGADAQAAQMQKARAQMEAMIQQGGPGADAARQALARMPAAGAGGSLFEVTMESSDFSTAGIPDSAFAIPAGFQKVDRK
jgi:hypothetical protein